MLGAFFSFMALIILMCAYFLGAVILAIIVIVIGLLASFGNYANAKKMRPTPMICPNCGSRNIRIQREISGLSGRNIGYYPGRLAIRSSDHTINRQRIGICKDCGFDYPYITAQECIQAVTQTKASMNFWVFLAIVAAGIGLWLYL